MSKSTLKAKADAPLAQPDQAKSQPTKAAGSKPSGGIAGAVARMDSDTREELERALGTKNVSFNANLFIRTARTAFALPGDDVHAGAEDMLNQTATLVAIKAFKPTDPVEAMLAAQAVMLHNLAMEAGRRAQLPQQSPDVSSRLKKDAANSARAMVEMTEALQRRRGKGPQVIRVEKMLVADGGQAVVGNVTTGMSLPASPLAPPAIGQGAPPIPMLDSEPVEAGVGEGT